MGNFRHADTMNVGEETRLIVETLRQVTPRALRSSRWSPTGERVPGFEIEPLVGPKSKTPSSRSASGWRRSSPVEPPDPSRAFSMASSGESWSTPSSCWTGRSSAPWSLRVTGALGPSASAHSPGLWRSVQPSRHAREPRRHALHQRRLDELVSQVAERLMSATATNRKEVLDWTTRSPGGVPPFRRRLHPAQRPRQGRHHP